LVKHRIEIPRRTTLARGAAQVEMVEHILAALAGLQIDNCRVCVDAGEMPGCDGSSLAFVHALTAAGIVRQDALRPQRIVRQPVRVADGDTWVEARPAFPGSRVSLRFQIDYGAHRAIGRQRLQMELTPEVFCRELAPSRTFLLEDEARWLQQQGLARRVTAADLLVFGDDGPIDNETRFDDECVRHKALDLVGDLALAGCDIIGHFVAHRSGHRLNAELVRALLVECEVVDAVRR
jgi:UDP-3-O-acyl N-acetylglucosamine deacetylase